LKGGFLRVSILDLNEISKNFGAIQALTNVSMTMGRGEVVGLMGNNGAGKSTLMRIIAGNFAPTHGTIAIDGRPTVFHKPVEARKAGVEIVYQDLALCDNLTAAANVFLGRELRIGFGPFHILDYGAMYRRAGDLFGELKSETRPRDLVGRMFISG
jgi:simple sugar transport system ATP-binding protein